MSESFSLPAFTMTDYNLYRVDDWIFTVFVIAALAFCLIHAAAHRAFRQPQPTEVHGTHPAGDEELQRHTLFQRIYHWANSVAIFTLVISGWLIYQPRQIPNLEGTPSKWFFWHRWGIALLLVGILAHIVREALVAKETNPVVFDRAMIKRTLSIFTNFFGFFKEHPLAGKYHTGQIFFHWAVAGNIFALILSGMVLWKPFRDFLPLSFLGLSWDFIYFSRVIHGFFSATLIASLIGHLYFALFIKKNWPESKSMFTGRMSLREYLESHTPPV
jgi:formate dehydrogenase subunit gamma